MHGTRNFNHPQPIGGDCDLDAESFLRDMSVEAASGVIPVAVHCSFDPKALKELRRHVHFNFLGLMRRNLQGQIASNFYWRVSGLLEGRVAMMRDLDQALSLRLDGLESVGIDPNLYAYLMLLSIESACNFNMELALTCDQVLFLEDCAEDPKSLARVCGITDGQEVPSILPRSNSHEKRAASFDFLPDIDSLYTEITEKIRLRHRDEMLVSAFLSVLHEVATSTGSR